jgi:AraC-like DNA-binding protein
MENRYSEFSPQGFCLQKIMPLKSNLLLPRFETLCKCILADGVARLKAYSIFYDLYADILPLLHREQIQFPAFDNIKNALEYIEQNSQKEFTVAYLAQMCLLSESRFYALFQKAIGCSPIAYRNNIRISKAINLLGGDFSIEEIAAKVGFCSAIFFRRIFKQIMGKLPSQYRKSLKFSYYDKP